MRTWEVFKPADWSLVEQMFGWVTLQVVDDRGNPQINTWRYARALIDPAKALQHGWPYLEAVAFECELALNDDLAHRGRYG